MVLSICLYFKMGEMFFEKLVSSVEDWYAYTFDSK